jgi:hypothetical protein
MDNRMESRACGLRWVAWVPLLGVGALMFWSMAFGLGIMSLAVVDGLAASNLVDMDVVEVQMAPTAVEPLPGTDNTINVHIQESAEAEDVNDNADAVDHASLLPND